MDRYNAFAMSPYAQKFIIGFDTTYELAVARCEEMTRSPYNDFGVESCHRVGDDWLARDSRIAWVAPFSQDLKGVQAYTRHHTRIKARRLEALGVRVRLDGLYQGETPLNATQKEALKLIQKASQVMGQYARSMEVGVFPYEAQSLEQLITKIHEAMAVVELPE